MLAAQEAGRAALVPGATAAEVNAACRAPIEEAGLGDAFRHRMGHGIGLDVHEPPFLSPEDTTPLEAGMTFTDEPSLLLADRFGVRVEDIIACAEGGGVRWEMRRNSPETVERGWRTPAEITLSSERETPHQGDATHPP